MKNAFVRLSGKHGMSEERISELEDMRTGTSQTEKQRERRQKTNKQTNKQTKKKQNTISKVCKTTTRGVTYTK